MGCAASVQEADTPVATGPGVGSGNGGGSAAAPHSSPQASDPALAPAIAALSPFLVQHNLAQYAAGLAAAGFGGLESLFSATEDELTAVIGKPGHVKKLTKQLSIERSSSGSSAAQSPSVAGERIRRPSGVWPR
jgi:hypothetical protein